MNRMRELIDLLNKASRAYYQEDREIMSDYEYDKLYDELVKLEKEIGVILSDSPTVNVGYKVLSNLEKVTHESKMLSLDKTKEISALESFAGDIRSCLSYKMDGLTVVLTYKNGELFQAVTRGNGEIGEDITHNARVFKNIPLKISYKGDLIIRGEAVISFKDFNKINESLEADEKYKNPRNLCSGSVRQLNSEIAAKRNIMFIAFSMVSAEDMDFEDLKSNQMKWLEELGFTIVENKIVNKDNIEKAVLEFEEKIPKNEYATDGLVLTYDSISYSKSLGATAKFPRDSIAFKWADEKAETVLRDIIWNTSRTGLINPIAVFDSVELEGTTVNRASLHNVSIVEDLKLGIGDKILVYKANMIIPQVESNLTQSGTAEIPKNCGVCGADTEIISLRDGKALKCTNPNCKAQQIKSISHFASRDAMNIDGFSEATIEKFIEKGFLDNYSDVFQLERFKAEIVNMEGFGEKSYNNLISAIEKAKNVKLANFIYALGINHVGLSNAKLLCNFYKNDIKNIVNAKEEELCQIEGFGEIISKSVCHYFMREENLKLFEKVLELLNIQKEEFDDNSDSLIFDKMSFVVTGDVHIYKNRKELQADIEALGGKVTGSVSAKTNYLINNDINSSSSKNKKAKELNIPIITEEDFIKMKNN